MRVKTYGEVIEAYRVHEESKSIGPDGRPCSKKSRGLLGRRDVSMLGPTKHIGKESNKLDERLRAELLQEELFLNTYEDRTCGCGCSEPVTGRHQYASDSHKQAAYRSRIRARGLGECT